MLHLVYYFLVGSRLLFPDFVRVFLELSSGESRPLLKLPVLLLNDAATGEVVPPSSSSSELESLSDASEIDKWGMSPKAEVSSENDSSGASASNSFTASVPTLTLSPMLSLLANWLLNGVAFFFFNSASSCRAFLVSLASLAFCFLSFLACFFLSFAISVGDRPRG